MCNLDLNILASSLAGKRRTKSPGSKILLKIAVAYYDMLYFMSSIPVSKSAKIKENVV